MLIANAAHPIDPRPAYRCTPLSITAWRSQPTHPGEARWTASPEGERAFWNTAELVDGLGESR